MGPQPAVAEVRAAVRRGLDGLPAGALVLAACSGGADSLALAAALAHVAPPLGLRGGGVTIDHGLQRGSADRAAAVAGLLARLGLDPVACVRVSVPAAQDAGGPESAARAARYAALDAVAARAGAAAVLLGHSLDDQAETVLLGLARGSGARSLAGMPARRGLYRRPLLGVERATLRAACGAQRLRPWEDPHNADPVYRRARLRHEAMPALERALGPGVARALARTAAQLAQDAEVLEDLSATEARRAAGPDGDWDAGALGSLPPALRGRVLRAAAAGAGCPGGSLGARHVEALDALVTRWRGQRWVDLPGGVRCVRRCGKLLFIPAGPGGMRAAAGPGAEPAAPGPGQAPERSDAEDLVGHE